MNKLTAVLFDLDGTLIDTAPDMSAALNRLLQNYGHSPIALSAARNFVSKGATAMVNLGFGTDLGDAEHQRLREEFLELYAENVCNDSNLFAGMPELLIRLETQGIPWGIVTNKPGWLTQPLLEQMQLWQRSSCTVSGDDLPERKPHPEPLLHACRQMGSNPNQAVYIGDDQRDIQAGLAAGMQTLVALYGYIDEDETPQHWGAHGMMEDVAALNHWLLHQGNG